MTRMAQREKALRNRKHSQGECNISEARNAQLLNSTAHFPSISGKNTI
jgi:hypothetical protein